MTTSFGRKLTTKETGLGWDPQKQTIKATTERWKKLRNEYKGCGKFEKAELQNIDLLSKMFEDIRNTGEDHWSLAMGSLPQSPVRASTPIDVEGHEDDNDDKDDNDQEDESPIISKRKRRCGLSNDKGKKLKSGSMVMQDHIKRIVELNEISYATFEAFVQKREQGSVCSIKDVMALVEECGAVSGTNEHFIASEIFIKKEQREMFMTLCNREARFDWLKRKYDAKYGK